MACRELDVSCIALKLPDLKVTKRGRLAHWSVQRKLVRHLHRVTQDIWTPCSSGEQALGEEQDSMQRAPPRTHCRDSGRNGDGSAPQGDPPQRAKQNPFLAASSREELQVTTTPSLHGHFSHDTLKMQMESKTEDPRYQKENARNPLQKPVKLKSSNISSHKIVKSVSALVLQWY